MAILVDFNQVLLSAINAGHSTFGSSLTEDMIRHMFYNMILSYKTKFSEKYGEVVICCDGPNVWRKKVYPYYKAKRAKGRAESPLDWEMIFQTMDKLRYEINEFMPYKLVHVDGAEGDDVIAVLVKWYQENEIVQIGLEERTQPVLIISADSDFIQLQEYDNVSQWTPMFKKMLIERNPYEARYEKIIKGDAGDGVPNCFSDDDTFVVEGKRQSQATKKKVEPIMDGLLSGKPWTECVPTEFHAKFDRNKTMIDLVDYSIPEDIVNEIIETYVNAKVPPRATILPYFMKYRLNNLAKSINQF